MPEIPDSRDRRLNADERAALACEWSDARSDYGWHGAHDHVVFEAGWTARHLHGYTPDPRATTEGEQAVRVAEHQFARRVADDRAVAALAAYYDDDERAFTVGSVERMRKALAAAAQHDADSRAILCGDPTPADLHVVQVVAEGMRSVPEPYRQSRPASEIWVDGYVAGRLAPEPAEVPGG